MRYAVVANAGSGAAAKLGRGALETLVRETLGARLVSIEIAAPRAVAAALDRAFAGDADAVAVIGGDGTCRSAAERARAGERPVVFLPGGTMNLLARRIWGERSLSQALEALGRGETRPVMLDAAEISGQLFLVAAMFGAAPGLTQARESFRRTQSLRGAARAAGEAMRGLRSLLRPTVQVVEPEGVSGVLPALIVTPGDASQALGGQTNDEVRQAAPSLECIAATVKGWAGVAVVALRVLMGGNWREDSRLVAFNAASVRVGARGRRLRLTLDGEVVLAANPATIRFLPAGLSALGPSGPEPSGASAV